MARTTNEELISLKGHITGIKNSLKLLSCSVAKLERRLEKLFWSIFIALGTLSMALLTLFLAK
jgi:hypothetical protein